MTDHGEERLVKRQGVGKKTASKITEQAREHGIKREDTKGQLRRYLDSRFYNNIKSMIVVYSGNVYIFKNKNGPLITMYSLPGNLKHRKLS